MKRTTFYTFFLAAFVTCLILVIACRKEDNSIVVRKEKLTGVVQKGPFVEASVSLYELNPTLDETGKSINTQISGTTGSFVFDNVALVSQYAELKANGYYWNEVSDSLSTYHITLRAISDIKDLPAVDINVLTHLEYERVKYLVEKGNSFTQAKDTAQKEVLSVFGLGYKEMSKSEQLDIFVNKEENALLLALSIILQGNRNARDLTDLLSYISTDIRQDGKLDDKTIIQKLRSSTINLDLEKIRSNIETRYEGIGISSSIPDFEKFINIFLSFTGLVPTAGTHAAENITALSATLFGVVKANDLSTLVTFEYGTTSSYGSTISASPDVVNGHVFTGVNAVLSGLNPSTIYHFRIKTVNSQGTVYGNDLSFTTLGKIPAVVTQTATNVTTEGATLNGTVNANDLGTTVTFEYGTDETYGRIISATPGKVTDNLVYNVSTVLTQLNPATLYYFRIKAVNLLGQVYGNNQTFKTLGGVPSAITTDANNIRGTRATLNGTVNANYFDTDITFEYGETTSYGYTVSAIQNPVSGGINTLVNVSVTGLIPETLYHFKIKAVNQLGTSYGNDLTFTTPPRFIYDVDGNTYTAVTIGNQAWMAENLKTTKFNDNTPIPLVTEDSKWKLLTSPGYCWYNNDETTYKPFYGTLYNWYAVDTILNGGKNLCPLGWHIPTIDEWRELISFIGGEQSCGKLMEVGTSHWLPPNSNANNETGFTGLPGGFRYSSGQFNYNGLSAYFYTSSYNIYDMFYVNCIRLADFNGAMLSIDNLQKKEGASVRCILDK